MSVVITGATGGVGQALANLFASKGHDLTLLGRDADRLKALSKSIRETSAVVVDYYLCDIENVEVLEESLLAINESDVEINLLINNAGVFPYGPVNEMNENVYNNCMDVNLKLPLLMSNSLYAKLADGGGKIVNIGSSSSYGGAKNTVLYCASKHALLGLSRALHDEWKDFGVSVHCVSPGTIGTEMANVLEQDSTTYIHPDEFAKLVYDVSSYSGNMLVEEVRAIRRVIR